MASNRRNSVAAGASTRFYEPRDLRDAPEFHAYSRALGSLTWGTWDHGERSFELRVQDFIAAFPPDDPTRFSPTGHLVRQSDGTYAVGTTESRRQRFLAVDWRPGSLHELLSRYGLKAVDGPPYSARPFEPGAFRETARKRNRRLRMLHGGVDVEPANMDAAKADFLDRQEAARAAQDVRDAVRRMNDELQEDKKDENS